MSATDNTTKYLLIGGATIAVAAGIWYLTGGDEKEIIYDPKVHTVEELRKVIHQMYLECAREYVKKLNMILNLKKENDFDQQKLDNFKFAQGKEMDNIEMEAYQQFKVDEYFMRTKWIPAYENDQQINEMMETLKTL